MKKTALSLLFLTIPVLAAEVVIPAGTIIAIKTIDAIDSEEAQPGKTYRASIDEPIVVDGKTLAPAAADAFVKITSVKQSGKLRGSTELAVTLEAVIVGGQKVMLATEEVTSSSTGRGKRSAAVIGGATAAGAAIGGLFGGKRGAATGAAAGAGTGTAVQVMTRGQRVRIPSETRLSFSVKAP